MRPHQVRARLAGGKLWSEQENPPSPADMGRGVAVRDTQIGPGGGARHTRKQTKAGESHRSPPAQSLKGKRRKKKGTEGRPGQSKQAGQAGQTPPGSRHCFMIPGAGPWVRGFQVCAGQLGSDRATARILLHRATFLSRSINHQAWARDARPGLGGGAWCCVCVCNVVHDWRWTGGFVDGEGGICHDAFLPTHNPSLPRVHVIAYALA